MESIEKYNVLRVKKIAATKEEDIMHIEEEMYYLLEEIRGLNKKVIDGEKAKEQLRKCRIRFEDLTSDMKQIKYSKEEE
jgi:hypothetical protein